jgi:hypothetical protein
MSASTPYRPSWVYVQLGELMLKTSSRKTLAALVLSVLVFVLMPACPVLAGVASPSYDAIYSGSPWYDGQGDSINAHGGQIIHDNGRYYWVGERRKDNDNSFGGFNLYSSTDLMNWRFERLILPVQPSGLLGPNRIGERPKIMKSPSTGEYVMFMHTDNISYTDPNIGYATSTTINGNYTFRGALLYNGSAIKKWDMGVFQDTDGSGYLLIHGGSIYKLASDYRSAASNVVSNFARGVESPAVFKVGGTYFWLGSGSTSWERNDNVYYTASALRGPWTSRGKFAPSGTLTWNSQTTSVFPIRGSGGTTYMFMGDRWAYPLNSRATYVWQPLTVSGTSISMSTYQEAWKVNTSTGTWSTVSTSGTVVDNTVYGAGDNQFNYSGSWTHTSGAGYNGTESRSKTAGSMVSIRFTGTQIRLYGTTNNNQGFATIALLDNNNATVATATLDFYSKYRESNELKYISPLLTAGTYTLKLTVSGSHGTWTDKAGNVYGSTDNYVAIDRAVTR